MLQQTRVETVVPYWERFLARFPDVASLASGELEEIYGLWAGLGYYARARNLSRAARAVMTRFGGALPTDAETLRSLPGIGSYTAGAVASIAFDRPEPVVDGNVARVLARRHGIRRDVKRGDGAKQIWAEAARLAHGPRPGDLNQALMELGAVVCRSRSPVCHECPWRSVCDARVAGDAEAIPRRPARARVRRVRAVAALIRRRGRVLLVRRPAGSLLGGLWELPGGALGRGERPAESLAVRVLERTGLHLADLAPAGSLRHALTHRSLHVHLFTANAPVGRVHRRGYDRHRWASIREMADLPVSTLTRKAVRMLLEGHAES